MHMDILSTNLAGLAIRDWQRPSLLEAERLLDSLSVTDRLVPSNAVSEDDLDGQLEITRSVGGTIEIDIDRFREHVQLLNKLASATHTRQLKARNAFTGLLMRSLPTEILSEIFCHYQALSSSRASRPGSGIKRMFSHLPLMWVCQSWRSVVLSQPLFWSYIAFELDNLPFRNCLDPREALSAISMWLERSASTLIDVDIRITRMDRRRPNLPKKVLSDSVKTLKPLFRSANRIRTLYMEIDPNALVTFKSKLEYPSLTEFSYISSSLVSQDNVLNEPNMPVATAPKLTKLKVMNMGGHDVLDLVRACQRIESLETNSFSLVLQTLSTFHQLISLIIRGKSLGGWPIERLDILHTGLRHLELDNSWNLNFLLEQLTFPSLESLEISRAPPGTNFWNETLLEFVSRCPQIQKISVNQCNFSRCIYEPVRDILMSLSSVTSLTIKESAFAGDNAALYEPLQHFLAASLREDVVFFPSLKDICYTPTIHLISADSETSGLRERYRVFATWLDRFTPESRTPGLAIFRLDLRMMRGCDLTEFGNHLQLLRSKGIDAQFV